MKIQLLSPAGEIHRNSTGIFKTALHQQPLRDTIRYFVLLGDLPADRQLRPLRQLSMSLHPSLRRTVSWLTFAVAGVYREIQNDLSDLTAIGLNVRAFLFPVKMADHGNIFSDQSKKRSLKVRNDRIHFYDNWFVRLSATQREQLLRERRSASCGCANFRNVIGQLAFDLALAQEQIAITENCRQEIIKIVSNAAGQLSESFHAL